MFFFSFFVSECVMSDVLSGIVHRGFRQEVSVKRQLDENQDRGLLTLERSISFGLNSTEAGRLPV